MEMNFLLNFTYIHRLLRNKNVRVDNNTYTSTLVATDGYSHTVASIARLKHQELSIVFQVEALLAILQNVCLLLFIMKHKKLVRWHSTKFFMNIQLSHIIMAVATIIIQHCALDEIKFVNNAFLFSLVLGMFLATTDRYVQIRFPILHTRLSTRNIFVVIMLSWLLVFTFGCCVLTVPGMQSKRSFILTTTVLLLVTFLVLVFTNMSVLLVAFRHQNEIAKLYKGNIDLTRKQKHSLKATKTCVTIVATYLLLWLPFLIHNLLALTGIYYPDGSKLFTEVVEIVALSNALTDPILFVLFHREVKGVFLKHLRWSMISSNGYRSNRALTLST